MKTVEQTKRQQQKIKAAIIGARGYSGLELARLLLAHPEAELVACFAHGEVFRLSDYLPDAAAPAVPVLPLSELPAQLPGLDTLFLATPAEASLELAAAILSAKNSAASVIDLSGAFRFQAAGGASRFQEWYKAEHTAPALLANASYGLVPFAKPVAGAKQLISNPGCYATAVLMGIVPLLSGSGVIDPAQLVIDAKSGTSGAGRKAVEAQLFTEVDGECLPYRIGKHQHLPEITEWAAAFGGQTIDPFFTTELLPVRRGITAGIFAKLLPGKTASDVAAAFAQAYKGYSLAKVTDLSGKGPQDLSPAISLSLKKVTGTARVHLSYQVVGSKLYLFSLIDNLLKGAASQAVENFNQLHDYPAALGLDAMEGTL